MKFEAWLKKQKDRDDPIGDLANDFISTGCDSIEVSMRKFTPCQAARDALREARQEHTIFDRSRKNSLYL